MPRTGELLWYVLWITLIAVGALLIAIIASRIVRKRLEPPDRSPSFTLQDLRELRDSGQITGPEYEAMRAAIIGQAHAQPDPPAPKRSEPRGLHPDEPPRPGGADEPHSPEERD